jgi:hypothetical protein
VAGVLLVVALAVVAGAAADGDPASDVLVSQEIFTPYPSPSASSVQSLAHAVQVVDTNGDRVKVAVIATPQDMGSVSSLFDHPQDYAKFLGIELSLNYRGPLLVVMPSGFGFARSGNTVAAADATLARLSLASGADGLTIAAARALPVLEHAALLHFVDKLAPRADTAPATVIAGRRVALRYQAWDDSGRAGVDLQVRNVKQVIVARFRVPLQSVRPGAWYWVVWRTPQKLAHQVVTSCIQAIDPSGNRSHRFCSKVTIT